MAIKVTLKNGDKQVINANNHRITYGNLFLAQDDRLIKVFAPGEWTAFEIVNDADASSGDVTLTRS